MSRLVQWWTAFVAQEESRWKETLRSEGARVDDEEPEASAETTGCGTKPESPSLLDEAAKRNAQIQHRKQ